MNDLLQVTPTLSPRLQWKAKYKVKTFFASHLKPEENRYSAWTESNDNDGIPYNPDLCGYGKTEEEACADLCRVLSLPYWSKLK